jgi:hypothetical protein
MCFRACFPLQLRDLGSIFGTQHRVRDSLGHHCILLFDLNPPEMFFIIIFAKKNISLIYISSVHILWIQLRFIWYKETRPPMLPKQCRGYANHHSTEDFSYIDQSMYHGCIVTSSLSLITTIKTSPNSEPAACHIGPKALHFCTW